MLFVSILLILIIFCAVLKLSNNFKLNSTCSSTIRFNPRNKIGLGNVLYGTLKINTPNNTIEINNVQSGSFLIYKKNPDSQEVEFIEYNSSNISLIFNDVLENYYFIFISIKEVGNNKRYDFMDLESGKTYIEELHILKGTNELLSIDNLYKILNINQYGECLYQTILDNYRLCLYNWSLDKNNELIAKNIEYGSSLHFYSLDFKKVSDIQFNILEDNNICFYFYKKECDSYYILMDFCRTKNIKIEIVKNKFEDDINTINYKIKIIESDIETIEFIYYCLNRVYTSFSNINVFSCGLYDNKQKSNTCGGSAIYNIPYMDYYKGIDGQFKVFNIIAQHSLSKAQKENYRNIVKNIYEKLNILPNYDYLPKDFTKDLISEDLMYIKIKDFIIQKNKENLNLSRKTFEDYLKEKYSQQYKQTKQKLIAKKIIKSKWKSEQELFKLVYNYYPDAIYQYRADWLGLQSLDIFIPSLKIAIEYQGEQHYKAVDIFGGEEGFQKRLQMDEKKRRLCYENNVKLIEWKYNETISQLMLSKKISNFQ